MTIINQDMDRILDLTTETILIIYPVYHERKLMGFNIISNGILLGTFDSLNEAMEEISLIKNCVEPFYYIRGNFC